MPKISVIIPVYKVERYLDACVASVAGQTYADLEIILVDDGSPDSCPAMCDAWAKKDARIKVIHQKNAGVSAARNVGIEQATGEFLAFADSDDIFEADVLSKAIKAQKKNGADIVIFNFLCTDAENRPLKDPDYTIFKDETINVEQLMDRFFSLDERCVYYALVWNKLYKASLFQSLRFQQGKRHEDMRLLPGLLEQCSIIECLGYQGYRHTKHSDSYMEKTAGQADINRNEFMLEWTSYFTQKGNALRAEGILNDVIQELAEKDRFDLSTPDQQRRYRTACRACADAYRDLAQRTGQRSMLLRAALLRLGLPVYQAFLKHKA